MPKYLLYIMLFSIALCRAETFPLPALTFEPLSYTCYKAQQDIQIDGEMSEKDWQNAPWTELFCDIEGNLKPTPKYETKIKMLHNDDGMYFFALLQEEHIWAKLTERDAVIFFDNDFEIFIDPNGDTHEYYELEINALGTLWDLFLIKPYRDDHSAIDAWDIREIAYAIGLRGTINDPSDTDESWSIEMFIPWKYLKQRAHVPVPPEEGDYWRLNFSRVHWDHEVIDGSYEKIPNKPEYNWVWSPQGLIAMHYPERWGYVIFTQQAPGTSYPRFVIPPQEHAKEYLRGLYYKQKQYMMDHGRYAKTLKELKAKPFEYANNQYIPRLEAISRAYHIDLDGGTVFGKLWIRDDGMCRALE